MAKKTKIISKDEIITKNYEDLLKLNKISKRLSRIEKDIFLLNAERKELVIKKEIILESVEE